MPTIADIPLLVVTAEVATNEDWRDSIPLVVAGAAAGYAVSTNIGNGTLSGLAVQPAVPIGNAVLEVTSISGVVPTYILTDMAGNVLGSGLVGAPYNAGGLTFTLVQGSTPFAVGDQFIIGVTPATVDPTGWSFALQLRSAAGSANVLLSASTAAATMVASDGALGLAIPQATMMKLPIQSCAMDIQALGPDGSLKRLVTGTVNVSSGITTTLNS